MRCSSPRTTSRVSCSSASSSHLRVIPEVADDRAQPIRPEGATNRACQPKKKTSHGLASASPQARQPAEPESADFGAARCGASLQSRYLSELHTRQTNGEPDTLMMW